MSGVVSADAKLMYGRIKDGASDLDQVRHPEIAAVKDGMVDVVVAVDLAIAEMTKGGYVHDLPLAEELLERICAHRAEYAKAYATQVTRVYKLLLPTFKSAKFMMDGETIFHLVKLYDNRVKDSVSKSSENPAKAIVMRRAAFDLAINHNSRLKDGFELLLVAMKRTRLVAVFEVCANAVDASEPFPDWFVTMFSNSPDTHIENLMLAHNASVVVAEATVTARSRVMP